MIVMKRCSCARQQAVRYVGGGGGSLSTELLSAADHRHAVKASSYAKHLPIMLHTYKITSHYGGPYVRVYLEIMLYTTVHT